MTGRATGRAKTLTALALTVAGALALAGCTSDGDASPSPTGTGAVAATGPVTLVTHDSFSIDKAQLAAFEKKSGITVKIVKQGDAGQLTNQLVLTKDAPLGDAVFGIDNTFATRAMEAGVLADYRSPALPKDAEQYLVGTHHGGATDQLTPIDYGDVCLNVDHTWFTTKKLAEPTTLDDLLKPEYKDLTVVENPATSSPGLAFLLATVAAKGEDGYLDWWKSLKANGLKVDQGWEDAYYTDFSGADGKGPRPVVLSYSSSPAYTLSKDESSTTTGALLDTCFRQVEYAGVLAGAKNPGAAQKVVDFLLSPEYQSTIADQMYMYPVSPDATLPTAWEKFAPLADKPWVVDPDDITTHRAEWIQEWTGAVVG
ncbi:thiamine ABC transporter substrate-binding protein [Luteimicrobium subarcticum]|uniref:Thiamine transport system substrate-binding protein n=1 Tax=Luteimicrobium subarcticum TaxID=620910 RepID=A0A2M8W6Y0_9MICO|nr:thiamine ABC transporter substrate-binding protein [Luteimicrobium subarcticum]PJI86690.1 thiamine transport system substrate-binding protein [Luteimicrobium subarcticum]